jgi:dTDP-4-amino-4,6-dideoxygalactose transaminase
MDFINLKRQYQVIEQKLRARMDSILSGARYINGSEVRELESQLADYVGVSSCVACSSGTDALLLPLMAWGIGAGDAVFVPTFTFFASAEAVNLVGAEPIFVDVDAQTYNLDPQKLADTIRQVKSEGRLRPRAVIAVDLFGQPADYASIEKIANEEGLLLLEDAAQGFGGRIGTRKAGSFGHVAATSFFPAKPLGCYGDGGAVFTDDAELAERMASIREHGKGADKYQNDRIGLNARLDTLQAAVLLEKLVIFDDELERRDRAAGLYREILGSTVTTPTVLSGYFSSWAQYSVLAENAAERERAMKHLHAKGIPTAVYYPLPLHMQKIYAGPQWAAHDFTVSEDICGRVVSLPMHPYLEEQEIRVVCDALKAVLRQI